MEEREVDITITEQEARELLQRYKSGEGGSPARSQAAIARELGISESAVSGFLSGTYKAPQKIVGKVQALMEANEKKKVAPIGGLSIPGWHLWQSEDLSPNGSSLSFPYRCLSLALPLIY